MLAAAQRIAGDADQAEQARRGRLHAVAEELAVLDQLGRRRGEGGEDRDRLAGVAAGGEDAEARRRPEAPDALAVLAPAGEPLLPLRRLRRGVGRNVESLAPRLLLLHPGLELGGREVGKGQQQVGEIPLGIDHQRRHAVDRRLFEERDAEPGLAAPGHAEADGVGHEVARIVEQRLLADLAPSPDRPAGRDRTVRASRNPACRDPPRELRKREVLPRAARGALRPSTPGPGIEVVGQRREVLGLRRRGGRGLRGGCRSR